jgi:hypothetical protein
MTNGQARALIWVMIGAGAVLRLVVMVHEPLTGDLEHFQRTAEVIQRIGFRAYGTLNAFDAANPFNYRSYSYPPGFVPWLVFADAFEGRGFAIVARIPPVLADLALAWLAQWHLRRVGAAPRVRVAAVALVAFGPVFICVSAVNGQIDGVAFVPVVLAALLWQYGTSERRAVAAGLLLGLGGLVKLVPLLFVLALLPTAHGARERALLLTSATIPMLIVLAPFVAADHSGVLDSLFYGGYPGGGGLAVLIQPDLARHYLTDYRFPLSAPGRVLQDVGVVITLVAVASVFLLMVRRRTSALEASLLLGLTLVVFATNFYEQYLLWLMPLAIICARIALVFVVQLIMLPYLLIAGATPAGWLDSLEVPHAVGVFIASIFVLGAVLLVGWASEVRRVLSSPLRTAPSPSQIAGRRGTNPRRERT